MIWIIVYVVSVVGARWFSLKALDFEDEGDAVKIFLWFCPFLNTGYMVMSMVYWAIQKLGPKSRFRDWFLGR